MGKLIIFFIGIVFVIIFPFFLNNSDNIKIAKNITPLTMQKGAIYEYNSSLKDIIKFSSLKEKENKLYFTNVKYLDKENNYTLISKNAIYNKINKSMEGKNYKFFTSNTKGEGKSFRKVGNIIYATDSKFYVKD